LFIYCITLSKNTLVIEYSRNNIADVMGASLNWLCAYIEDGKIAMILPLRLTNPVDLCTNRIVLLVWYDQYGDRIDRFCFWDM